MYAASKLSAEFLIVIRRYLILSFSDCSAFMGAAKNMLIADLIDRIYTGRVIRWRIHGITMTPLYIGLPLPARENARPYEGFKAFSTLQGMRL